MSTAYDAHDALGLAALVDKGELTPAELLDEALARAEAVNPKINAFASLRGETARRLIEEGLPQGPFRGVPFLLKDLGAEAVDFPVTSGSRLTKDTVCPGDSEFYRRLKAAGLVTFGRTTSPEFGVGPATEAAVYGGPTRNPWNTHRTSGGSSGGAAAAVAAGVLPAAHASDGAGSIRIPASSSGLFGLKPTRARVPAGPFAGEGWAGLATSGFVSRSVRDSAALFDAVMGPDLGDPYAAPPLPMSLSEAAVTPPGRLRIGFLKTNLVGEPIHADCRAAVESAAALLEELGHEVFEADPPQADTEGAMEQLVNIIACGSALAIRKVLRARGRELEPGEVEPLALGAIQVAEGIDGAAYLEAVGVIHAYGRALARYLTGMDVLLTSTLAEPPAQVGRFAHTTDDFRDYRLGPDGVLPYSPFTAAFNASGQPAASVPLFWNDEGLPIGVHLAAPFGEDARLISLSAQLESARPWFDRRPPVWAGPTGGA
ncbi:MAG: amidase [Pseudomonadota bacterium]